MDVSWWAGGHSNEKRVNLSKKFDKDSEGNTQTKGCKEPETSVDKTVTKESDKTLEREKDADEVDRMDIAKNDVKDMEGVVTGCTEETDTQKQALEETPEELKIKEKNSQVSEEKDVASFKKDIKNINEKTAGCEDGKKLEDKYHKCEETNTEKNESKEEDSIKHFEESTSFKGDDKELKEENPTLCVSEKGEDCKISEFDCKKTEEEKQNDMTENLMSCKKKTEDEEDLDKKKKSLEEEPCIKMQKSEDTEQDTEVEKKFKKSHKREQEEDHNENQDSKDWVSEEEGSFTGNRKRKISGGDFVGSSSPLISESAPNSPASTHYGDDSENERAYRSWKKPIMILWNEIAAHKFASLFLRPITDDQAPGYHSVVHRSMDLQKVKRNMENGLIRTTAEFQRDIMLMFLNAKMYNTSDHNVYHMADQMMQDAVSTIEEFLNTQMLARAQETPQKSLRRETRESSAKRSDEDFKRKRDSLEDKGLKKRRL
ncbi:Bromodomain-containing protein 8-like [Homarus americanus]|uniref:Bromodomain-containing protein 8-like n=1 Tax=Homarus americanus TaxID=6706 RepID=A0A8J5NCZ6_HOMAM|nr:Bromodomain-containing protein 8-like [Homarus americanus]